MPNLIAADNESDIENDIVSDTVNVTENNTVKTVYDCIKKDGRIMIVCIMKKLGKSRPTITRAISELKKSGYIERVGSDRAGSWKILK